MRSVSALGRRSWWPPNETGMPHSDLTADPDAHGGWYLGPWHISDASVLRPLYVGVNVLRPGAGWPDSPAAREGAWILHTYTEEERTALLAMVTEAPVVLFGIREGFTFDGRDYHEYYRERLIKLLSDPDDPPVYYRAY